MKIEVRAYWANGFGLMDLGCGIFGRDNEFWILRAHALAAHTPETPWSRGACVSWSLIRKNTSEAVNFLVFSKVVLTGVCCFDGGHTG